MHWVLSTSEHTCSASLRGQGLLHCSRDKSASADSAVQYRASCYLKYSFVAVDYVRTIY